MYYCKQCKRPTAYLLADGSCKDCFDFEAHKTAPLVAKRRKGNKEKRLARLASYGRKK